MKHIGGFDVCNQLEHRHQLRQIVKSCEAGLSSVSRSFGCQLDCGHGFSIHRRPRVEVLQVVLLECGILEIALDGVEFHHRIGDGCAGSKDCSTPSGQLIKIAALHKKVAGFHCLGLCDTAYISHFGIEIEIFVVVTLVDKKPINAKLLKGHGIVLSALIVQLVQL